jgi:hypothetical protein
VRKHDDEGKGIVVSDDHDRRLPADEGYPLAWKRGLVFVLIGAALSTTPGLLSATSELPGRER